MRSGRSGELLVALAALALLARCGAGNDPPFDMDGAGDTTPADLGDTVVDTGADTGAPDTMGDPVDPGWDEVCGTEDLPLEYAVSSDVLIVLDRSASMMGTLDNVKSAINTIVGASEDKIWFGLMPFPSSVAPNECAMVRPLSECNAPATPHVMLGPLNAAEIAGVLSGLNICGSTPTSVTLANAHAYLSSTATGHTQYVLLATDGVPNCNAALDPTDPAECECPDSEGCTTGTQCLDDDAAYAALDALHADGVLTYVLGMGSWLSVDREVMNNMAEHGGTGTFYPAETPASILTAFEAIMGTVVLSCIFDLHPSDEVDPTKVNLYVGGDIVPRDTSHTNGWDYVDEDTIEFFGDWCGMILSGSVSEVSAAYGCPTWFG